MKEQFVTYEIALKLKELGFDEDCIMSLQYINDCNYITKIPYEPSLWIIGHKRLRCDITKEQLQKDFNGEFSLKLNFPLWQQVTKWLREVHKTHISIWFNSFTERYRLESSNDNLDIILDNLGEFDTYEQALEKGLNETLKLIENDR